MYFLLCSAPHAAGGGTTAPPAGLLEKNETAGAVYGAERGGETSILSVSDRKIFLPVIFYIWQQFINKSTANQDNFFYLHYINHCSFAFKVALQTGQA